MRALVVVDRPIAAGTSTPPAVYNRSSSGHKIVGDSLAFFEIVIIFASRNQ
jgi:hypothetical protein